MKKIPEHKWLQIYTALKLIKFYSFTVNNNFIISARETYEEFNNSQYPNDNESNPLDSIPNTISFLYLLIARTNEILEQYIDDELPIVHNEIWHQIQNNFEVTTFEEVLSKFGILIIDNKLPEKWKNKNDHEKFFGFLSNIRNSISHWRYELIAPKIILKDRPNKNSLDNFHIEMQYHQLLNFTDATISSIHDYLLNNRIQ
jgi:hypothetical protein